MITIRLVEEGPPFTTNKIHSTNIFTAFTKFGQIDIPSLPTLRYPKYPCGDVPQSSLKSNNRFPSIRLFSLQPRNQQHISRLIQNPTISQDGFHLIFSPRGSISRPRRNGSYLLPLHELGPPHQDAEQSCDSNGSARSLSSHTRRMAVGLALGACTAYKVVNENG
jgi:hypothetical protein